MALMALLTPVCAPTRDTPVDAARAEDATAVVRYRTDVTLGAARLEAGVLVVTNDLGLTFRLTDVWVGDYAVALVPCEAARRTEVRWPSGLAWANHGEPTPTEVLVALPHSLLAPPASGDLAVAALEPIRYCTAYLGTRRVRPDWEGRPSTPALDGFSLVLRGTWVRPGEAAQPLSAEAIPAVAALIPVSIDGMDRSVTVTFVRDLGRLMDGLDPRALQSDELAYRALRNLQEHVTVTVR